MEKKFIDLISSFEPSDDPLIEKEQIKKIINVVPYDIIKNDPSTFFNLHMHLINKNLLSLGIRFTVQYNLFAGTILTHGNDEMKKILNSGVIGSFALTEQGAGVNSGLVINTVATKCENGYHLKTKDPKIWIGQGCTADYIIVFALIDRKTGIFLVDLKKYGKVSPMPTKTVCNGLDSALIYFDDVVPENSFMMSDKFLNIAQRLLTGRYIIGRTSIHYFSIIYKKFIELNERSVQVTRDHEMKLKEFPRNKKLIEEIDSKIKKALSYLSKVEEKIVNTIKNDLPWTDELVEEISIGKIYATGIPIEYINKMKLLIGSQHLIVENNLGANLDIFYMCVFAEGSSELLLQKIGRDHLSLYMKIKFFLLNFLWGKKAIDFWFENYFEIVDNAKRVIMRKMSVVG